MSVVKDGLSSFFTAAWGLRIGFLYLNTCCYLQKLTKNIHTVLGIRLLTLHDGRFVFHNLVGAERLLLHSSLPPINGILEFYQTFPSRLRVPIGCLLINPTEKDWLFPHWSAILDTCCKLVFYLILVYLLVSGCEERQSKGTWLGIPK